MTPSAGKPTDREPPGTDESGHHGTMLALWALGTIGILLWGAGLYELARVAL